MEKRAITAIVLCLLVAILYPRIIVKFYPDYYKKPVNTKTLKTAVPQLQVEEKQELKPALASSKKLDTIRPAKVNKDVKEREVEIDTKVYKAVFSNYGGCLKKIFFKKIKNGKAVKAVIEPLEPGFSPLAITRLGDNYDIGLIPFNIKQDNNKLVFSYEDQNRLSIKKEFIFADDSYLIAFNLYLKNLGGESLLIKDGYDINCGTLFGVQQKRKMDYLGVDGLKGNNSIHREKLKKISGKKVVPGDFKWVGVRNKTFGLLLIFSELSEGLIIKKYKDISTVANQTNTKFKNNGFCGGLRVSEFLIKPGQEIKKEFFFFAGAKYLSVLKELGYNCQKLLNLGIFSSISVLMIYTLNFLYNLTGNYGIAIILLTIIIKVILHPLTQKSFKSMNKMKELQPLVNQLKEKYKDNAKKMQTEMMALYKRNKVNPLGGCLPMLLQMPVFFALFATIRDFVELQGASFLWAKDLSGPDTVAALAGLPINPLPLIMGASMYWQQKMSTVDPSQQKMMMFMPVFFTFILYNFSSGLVIYWLVNNILTIAQQYMTQKKPT